MQLTVKDIDDSINSAAAYLRKHMRPSGRFDYEVNIASGVVSRDYNLLRHAGTVMVLYQLGNSRTGDKSSVRTADFGLRFLKRHLFALTLENEDCICLAEDGTAKLGGAALTLLCLHEKHSGLGLTRVEFNTAASLANYIITQLSADGTFISKIDLLSGHPFAFKSRYYPGQAILALCAAFELTHDERYLAVAKAAIERLMLLHYSCPTSAADFVDHWAMIAIDRLHAIDMKETYVDHLRHLTEPLLQFDDADEPRSIWDAITDTTPITTRLEGLISALNVELRTIQPVRAAMLLDLIMKGLTKCLERQIGNPRFSRDIGESNEGGGFLNSPTGEVIRIDYVQHAIAALLGTSRAMASNIRLKRHE